MVPVRHQLVVGACCLAFDVLFAMVPVSLFFLLGGMNWRYIFIPALVFPVISFFLSFFIYESPRYLYARGLYPELRKTMSSMSALNGGSLGSEYKIDKQERHLRSVKSVNTKSKFSPDLTILQIF